MAFENVQHEEKHTQLLLNQLNEVLEELTDLNVGGRAELTSNESKDYIKEVRELMKGASKSPDFTGALVAKAEALISDLEENVEPSDVIKLDEVRAKRAAEAEAQKSVDERRAEKIKQDLDEMVAVSQATDWDKQAKASVRPVQQAVPTPAPKKGKWWNPTTWGR